MAPGPKIGKREVVQVPADAKAEEQTRKRGPVASYFADYIFESNLTC
jgi:hypothetical protein